MSRRSCTVPVLAWWIVFTLGMLRDPSRAIAAGELDPAFGSGGFVTTSIGTGDSSGSGLVVQSDGAIVVAGSTTAASMYGDSVLLRYDATGVLDPTFGAGGILLTSHGTGADWLAAVRQQPDGKLVAAGSALDLGGQYDGMIVRRGSDGTLDGSFGSGGVVRTPIGSAGGVFVNMLLEPDGSIVTAGNTVGVPAHGLVARYVADGTLDATFGTGGIATTTFGDLAYVDVLRQPDGKLVAAGYAFLGVSDVCVVARFEADGTPDASFGSGGLAWVTQPVPLHYGLCLAAGLQSDGKIVMVGSIRNTPDSRIVLYRFLPDGQLDSAFGSGGIVETLVGDAAYANDVLVQPDDRLVVVGETWTGTRYDILVLRYLADGTLDTDFGTAGVVNTEIGPIFDNAFAVVRQSDAKLVVTGAVYHSDRPGDVAVVRYIGDGPAPSTTSTTTSTSSSTTLGSGTTTSSTTTHSTTTSSSTSTSTSSSTSSSTTTSIPACTCADPCEVCSIELGCHVPDVAGCVQALPRHATLTLKDDASAARNQLAWKWKSAAGVATANFGDPTAASAYALCVLERPVAVPIVKLSVSVPAGENCDGHPCWRSANNGFRYADASAAHGIRAIQLKSGPAGRAKATVKGKGLGLAMPVLGLAAPVTTRLVRVGTPSCWESTFSAPTRNDVAVFKARSD